jgi:threonine synthase
MAGASLITKIDKAFHQLTLLGLVESRPYSLHGAQPAGCNPVVRGWKEGLDRPPLVKPSTIVRSLSIGDPADGPAALATIRRTEGRAEDATDPEVIDAMRLLARTEGLFGETAGGTVVAAARRLAQAGAFADGGSVVLLVTGHGLKTVEALADKTPFSTVIDGRLEEFEEFWSARHSEPAPARA